MQGQLNSLKHFQQHSRLHFIGRWRTKAEDILRGIYQEHPEWCHGAITQQHIFVHFDMDAYFCSVALSKEENAVHRDKPVVIAAGKNNSDVSSCNYVARKRGVHAGMWVAQARELCPDLVILGYDLARCEELNAKIYQTLLSCCPPHVKMSLEVYSVDDVMLAFDTNDYTLVSQYCDSIREEVCRVTNGCTASCGIGPSILIARLATATAKPDGVAIVQPDDVSKFVAGTLIKDLHGIGRVTLKKMTTLIQGLPHRGGWSVSMHSATAKQRSAADESASHVDVIQAPPGLVRAVGFVTDERRVQIGNSVTAEQGAHMEKNNVDNEVEREEEEEEVDSEESEDGEDATESAPITCGDLQRVAKSSLQAALGNKVGEQFYCMSRGIDSRLVKRTGDVENQTLLGKTLPHAVACSMNYAVRPLTVADVADIIHQLVGDVAAKLRRLHACAQHARVSILERHPDYPKVTTKFMGTGRCVEFHIPITLPQAVTGEQEDLMHEHCCAGVEPRFTCSESEKKANSSHKILVEDIRGVTLQLSSIRPIIRRTESGTEMLPTIKRAIGCGSFTGQISLTAAFRTVSARKREREEHEEGLRERRDVVVVVDEEDSEVDVNSVFQECLSSSSSLQSVVCLSSSSSLPALSAGMLHEAAPRSLHETLDVLADRLALDSESFIQAANASIEWWIDNADVASPIGLLRMCALWASEGSLAADTFSTLHIHTRRLIAAWVRKRGGGGVGHEGQESDSWLEIL